MKRDKKFSNELVQSFYEDLRKNLRRFEPQEFCLFLSQILRRSLTDRKLLRQYPPHFIIVALEANLFYYNKFYERKFSINEFNKVIKIIHEYLDPYQRYELDKKTSEGLLNFLISTAQNQFPIQRRLNLNIWARSLFLFVDSIELNDTRSEYLQSFNLSVKEWLLLCFALFSWFGSTNSVVLTPENITNSEVGILPKSKLITFLELISVNPTEFSQQYNQLRDQLPPFLRIFVKSIFFDFPLIRFGDKYINPHPNLFSYLAYERVFSMLSSVSESFENDFGKVFERYVRIVLQDLEDVDILDEKQIKERFNTTGKVCDYYVEFEDCILLVETKAVQYTLRILNLDYLRNSNSSKKVAKAYDQILNVAKNIQEVVNKKIFGICVTFGQLRFPNIEPYYVNTILPNMTTHDPMIKINDSNPPQTLSIENFENFISLITAKHFTVEELFQDFFEERRKHLQDWDAFLSNLFSRFPRNHETILSKRYQEYFKNIGIHSKW